MSGRHTWINSHCALLHALQDPSHKLHLSAGRCLNKPPIPPTSLTPCCCVTHVHTTTFTNCAKQLAASSWHDLRSSAEGRSKHPTMSLTTASLSAIDTVQMLCLPRHCHPHPTKYMHHNGSCDAIPQCCCCASRPPPCSDSLPNLPTPKHMHNNNTRRTLA